jgi:hypothetical protein
MSHGEPDRARVLDKSGLAHSEAAYEFEGHHNESPVSRSS